MIEVSVIEIALFIWGIVMTALWLDSRKAFYVHKVMTAKVFDGIAKGKLKVVDNGDSFELKEI